MRRVNVGIWLGGTIFDGPAVGTVLVAVVVIVVVVVVRVLDVVDMLDLLRVCIGERFRQKDKYTMGHKHHTLSAQFR